MGFFLHHFDERILLAGLGLQLLFGEETQRVDVEGLDRDYLSFVAVWGTVHLDDEGLTLLLVLACSLLENGVDGFSNVFHFLYLVY